MPTYEYRCRQCGTDFEKFQRMSDEPVAECPKCGSAAERRLSAGAGLLFKGSGFYITDYRSDSYKKAASGESSGGSGGGESKGGESKGGESKGGESKGGESKGGESEGGESKGGESKGGGSSSESKPAAKPAKSGGGSE
jgi:putative FmdB family regulatory protein